MTKKLDTSRFSSRKAPTATADAVTRTGVLVGDAEAPAAVKAGPEFPFRAQQIPLEEIKPNPEQPRKTIAGVDELAESLGQYGVIQPLIVMRQGDRYLIVAGERRYHAAIKAGLDSVPAIIRPASKTEQDLMMLALTENVQREDLPPIEEARAIKAAMEAYDLSQVAVAKRMGKSRRYVQDSLSIIANLDVEMLEKAQQKNVGKSALVELAAELPAVSNPDDRQRLFSHVLESKSPFSEARKLRERRKAAERPKQFRQRITLAELPGSVSVSIPKEPDQVTREEVHLYLSKALEQLNNEGS